MADKYLYSLKRIPSFIIHLSLFFLYVMSRLS
jgi:hypothetical protein